MGLPVLFAKEVDMGSFQCGGVRSMALIFGRFLEQNMARFGVLVAGSTKCFIYICIY